MQRNDLAWLRVQPTGIGQIGTMRSVEEHLFEHGILCEVNRMRWVLVAQASRRWVTVLPLRFSVTVREYSSLEELLTEYDTDKRYRIVKSN